MIHEENRQNLESLHKTRESNNLLFPLNLMYISKLGLGETSRHLLNNHPHKKSRSFAELMVCILSYQHGARAVISIQPLIRLPFIRNLKGIWFKHLVSFYLRRGYLLANTTLPKMHELGNSMFSVCEYCNQNRRHYYPKYLQNINLCRHLCWASYKINYWWFNLRMTYLLLIRITETLCIERGFKKPGKKQNDFFSTL